MYLPPLCVELHFNYARTLTVQDSIMLLNFKVGSPYSFLQIFRYVTDLKFSLDDRAELYKFSFILFSIHIKKD